MKSWMVTGALLALAVVAGLDGPSRTIVVEPVETPTPTPLPERSEPEPEREPAREPAVEPEPVPA